MQKPGATPATLPEHFEKEWSEARQLIDKQDERIHETRKTVFGLFSSLLTASSIFAAKDLSGHVWVGIHLSLLGLLVTGRFVEQQSLLLQAATASRAFVLELLTPVELTGILSDRFRGWARRTTYIYMGLGFVSTFVAIVVGGTGAREVAVVLVLTALYVAYIVWLGRRDITFARDGQDWSFSTTSCRVGEVVSILLTNLGDKPLLPADPVAELRLVFEGDGKPAFDGTAVPLSLHSALTDVGVALPPRRPFRWVWQASKAGLWALKVHGEHGAIARRCIHVQAPQEAPYRNGGGI